MYIVEYINTVHAKLTTSRCSLDISVCIHTGTLRITVHIVEYINTVPTTIV